MTPLVPVPRSSKLPTGPTRMVVGAGLNAAGDVYGTAARGWRAYWSAAADRRSTPMDLLADTMAWSVAVSTRRAPQWASANAILAEWPIARLRDFSVGGGTAGTAPDTIAVLVLPPQAGHDSCIVDFAPEQSQVRTAAEAGLTRVFCLDWKPATPSTRSAGVEDYLSVIKDAVVRVGGRVHLVGDCQGGWLATIYAALHPEDVVTLTIAGAPVDFHAGEPVVQDWMRALSPRGGLLFYRAVVAAHRGVLPGEFLLAGFKAMQPAGELTRSLQLLTDVRDEVQVERHQRFEDWFNFTQPIAGSFYLWIVEHLFQRNELVRGELRVGGELVDLARITMPVHLLAGADDHITPAPQVFALGDHVGTPDSQVNRYTAPGGHLGLFMGRAALRSQWMPIFTALANHAPAAQGCGVGPGGS